MSHLTMYIVVISLLLLSGCDNKEIDTKNPTIQKAEQKEEQLLAKKPQELAKEAPKESQESLPKTAESKETTPEKANTCASCHGKKGEKIALGKSKIINQLSRQEIIDALKGYQKGTYGGAMKSLMASQAKNLSPKEIEELAQFYSSK